MVIVEKGNMINGMKEKRKIDRREFIKEVSFTGLGVAVGASLISKSERKLLAQDASRIVIANHPEAVTGIRLNQEIVQKIVDAGIMQYTGQKTVADAWASVLPSLSAKDIVTIKVNCINSSLSTHPEFVDAIVTGLVSAGVTENNIIIWDRTNHELISAGYKYNIGNTGVRCFGTNEKGWGYDKQVKLSNQNVRLSKILMNTTHLINAPVLKDHGTSGITISMKNHYGSVDNPENLHGGECDPYIAELNNVPDIKTKTRIIVLDALLGIFRGGPIAPPQFVYNSVIFGQDPVALDYTGWTILRDERQKNGQNLPLPRQIKTANKLGLGTSDPKNIIVEKINVKDEFAVIPSGKKVTTWGARKL